MTKEMLKQEIERVGYQIIQDADRIAEATYDNGEKILAIHSAISKVDRDWKLAYLSPIGINDISEMVNYEIPKKVDSEISG